MTIYETYLAANERMDGLIDLAPDHDGSVESIRARARERFRWMQRFVQFQGNPQYSVPVIHVTGTSGKGSTATAIASILHQAGLRTLLHTSPYLQVATEKLQINGRLISADDLSSLTDEVLAAADRFAPGEMTYGEAWMALVFLAMDRFRPDVAIVEVGAGGRYDVSNVVLPKVAVITTVGMDHVESLGDTLEEIASHKAGIIKPGVALIHSVAQPEAIEVVTMEAREVGVASLRHVTEQSLGDTGSSFDVSWSDEESGITLRNGIPGFAQRMNGAVAAAAARAFHPDLPIDVITAGLAEARIPARFERMPGQRTVILDGAHNEQKMSAIVQDLAALPRPRVAVVGFLASKRFEDMLAQLAPHVDQFVISEPRVTGKDAADRRILADRLSESTGIQADIANTTPEAIDTALALAGSGGSVVVTGSLYLCGQARERWFSSEDIVVKQTQWPGLIPGHSSDI